MNRRAGAPRHWQPKKILPRALGAVLLLALLAAGYGQWRQVRLLDAASHLQSDALGWSFAQLETEQLRLSNALQTFLSDPQAKNVENVQLRYDIFVSRIDLVDHERAAALMHDQPAYIPAIAQAHEVVKVADRYLGEHPARPLDAAAGRELAHLVDALNAPLHDLSLGASHLLYEQATERYAAVRQQSQLGIALTAFQCLLLLVLAFIVVRQLRALTVSRRSLEALADTLGKARRDAEAASRAKSAFLANMSHEIRTPFHGMLGMMSLLQEAGLTPQQAMYLDTARESAQHLLTILNDILDVSQLESGRLHVVPQTVDLPQLIAQVDALMRVQAQAKGLEMVVDLAPDVPRWIGADPTRLKQILFNLLSNAVKFTDVGSIGLTVTLESHGRIDFAVSDTGVGIDAAAQSRLFQRFVQGDDSPSRRADGAGLGLEISRDLARLMNGDLTVRSEPGKGSMFTASLPLPAVNPPVHAVGGAETVGATDGRPLHVLVAEDHPVNRAYLEAVLERLGHQAVFVADGDGAVRAVKARPDGQQFDVVLMDLHMPRMDGFAAARAIRAMPAPHGRVPIIALTADAYQASRQLAGEAGMDGYLTKPAHLPQLRDALARYTGGGDVATSAPSPRTTTPEDALLDLTTIEDVRQHLPGDKHIELLGRFFAGSAAAVEELRSAISARPDLRSRAHALKGAALSLGLKRVGELAQQLQVDAAEASEVRVTALIHQLDAAMSESALACRRVGLLAGAAPAEPRALSPQR
jgi:signal transduction histidine kinase/DNA-binding NarL/FixJ family response regulator/HPt (histidine-containing phosphotransfer) domain-containing protein